MALKQAGIAAAAATDLTRLNDLFIPRNRVFNPAMWVDQANLGAAVAVTAIGRLVDGISLSISAGGVSCQRVNVPTPGGSAFRQRATVTTAITSLSAGSYAVLFHCLEDVDISDLGFGTAGAKAVTLRFGFKGPAGTYSACLKNGDGSRSYVTNFTITSGQANTDTLQVFNIPGDTSGTWSSFALGMYIEIAVAAGTTYQTSTLNAWTSANVFGSPSTSNGMSSTSNVFELFDLGLYAGNYAPPFSFDSYGVELQKCQRYYQIYTQMLISTGYAPASTGFYIDFSTPIMRAVPTVSFSGITYNNCSALAINTAQANHIRLQAVATAAGAAYVGATVTLDARLS